MNIIDFKTINALGIPPRICVDWVDSAFRIKQNCILPPKISIKMPENVFFNTMPCFIPQLNKFGVKEVSRFPMQEPSLKSEILLFDASNGNFLSLMDATWITCMRTGAVAALAAKTLKKTNAKAFSFVGLGNTARATMLCMLEAGVIKPSDEVRLLAYKNQADLFVQRFSEYGLNFKIVTSNEDLIRGSDVIISCVTSADVSFGEDAWFDEGVLLIPVHTRGFQNCDLFFDKVIVDDIGHVEGFKYFDRFKRLGEFSDVLNGKIPGRESDSERIIAYNIGIALHDVYFASKIFDMHEKQCSSINMGIDELQKFWI